VTRTPAIRLSQEAPTPASLARGHVVEFTLPAIGTVRGEIRSTGSLPGTWHVLGSDGELYDVAGVLLTPLTGRTARRVAAAVGLLRSLHRVKAMIAEEDAADRQTAVSHARERERPPATPHHPPAQPDPAWPAADVPYALHDLDQTTPLGPDWTPAFTTYMSAHTGPHFAGLRAMTARDPRLRIVYHVCVQCGHPPDGLAVHLGISGRHVRRLQTEAETIMAAHLQT